MAAASAEEPELSRSQIELDRIRQNLNTPTTFSDAKEFLPLESMKDVFLKDDVSPYLKNGVTRSSNGMVHIATSVQFPKCAPKCLAWWFSGGVKGDSEYQRWHPEDHFSGHWWRPASSETETEKSSETASASSVKFPNEPWIGCEHRVVEALGTKNGGKPLSLRIKFCDPNTYGITSKLMKESNCQYAFTARVCISDPILGWLDVGHFIHFTQPLSKTTSKTDDNTNGNSNNTNDDDDDDDSEGWETDDSEREGGGWEADLYDQSGIVRSWKFGPEMNHIRCGLGSCSDYIHNRIFVAGGYGGGTVYHETAEMIDLTQNSPKWIAVPNMSQKRTGCGVSMGPDGCFYVAGGSPDGSRSHRTAERYDPREGQWQELPNMVLGRSYCSGTFTLSQNFMVSGGMNGQGRELRSVEIFDVQAHKWSIVASSKGTLVQRADHASLFVDFLC